MQFQSYIDELRKWTESTDSNEKVTAIFNYLSKKTLVHDLVEVGIFFFGSESANNPEVGEQRTRKA